MQTCWLQQLEKAGVSVLDGITFMYSEDNQSVPFMVHMYNLFARNEEIQALIPIYSIVALFQRLQNKKYLVLGGTGSNSDRIHNKFVELNTHPSLFQKEQTEANCGTPDNQYFVRIVIRSDMGRRSLTRGRSAVTVLSLASELLN